MNSRFLPMGVALAPSLPGGAAEARALQGQTVVDASWAMAARGDGDVRPLAPVRLDARSSTSAGSAGRSSARSAGDVLGDPHALGLDAVYPAFFLALLLERAARPPRARSWRGRRADRARAVPIAPAGVPVLAASLAALLGLHARRAAPRARRRSARP